MRVCSILGTKGHASARMRWAKPKSLSCLTEPLPQQSAANRNELTMGGRGAEVDFFPLFFPLTFWSSNDNGLVHYKQFPNCS